MKFDLSSSENQSVQTLICFFSKGPGEDGEKDGSRVDREEDDQQDFGVGDGEEWNLEGSRDVKEGDGSHAEEVGKYEHNNALGDLGVGAPPGDDEGTHVEEEDEEEDENLCRGIVFVHG